METMLGATLSMLCRYWVGTCNLYVEQLEDKTLDETKFRKQVGTYLLAKLSPVEESLDKTMARAKGIEILVKDIFEGENYILSSISDYNQKRFLYDAENPASE